jgi:carbonic anhydrase/acetyltransferase-like protein (isoleucine patch superfamily)
MPIVPHLDDVPVLGQDVYLAPTAYVVGRVRLGDRCSLWYGATVRGDSGTVEIGDEVSIQEAATVHTEDDRLTKIGSRVTMGHHALVHAATVGDDCIIGVNASVLTGASVGSGSIVAAHAVVPEGRVIPPNSLVVGVPGKVIREVSDAERARIQRTKNNYLRLGANYRGAPPAAATPDCSGTL